jgi:hypothetical protein
MMWVLHKYRVEFDIFSVERAAVRECRDATADGGVLVLE